jgi:hypothetical protein
MFTGSGEGQAIVGDRDISRLNDSTAEMRASGR